MRNISAVFVFVVVGLVVSVFAHAIEVDLYVDTAPNVYGSADWAPWWAAAKPDVADGTFVNMGSTAITTPGALQVDPYDEIVYSTGDLGRRLHWIYWLPGQTIAGLEGKFEVKWVIDWGGSAWTYDGGGWAADAADVGWSQPTKWEEYNGGVIGSLGFAWWATDNDAPPLDSYGNPYDETDQADIDALRADVLSYQTYATGMVRVWNDTTGGWDSPVELQLDVVPEPLSMLMLSCLGAGMFGARRLKRRKS